MATTLPPPPNGAEQGDFVWTAWYNSLYSLLTISGSITWGQVDKAGSSLSDIAIRPHSALTSIQGGALGEYYHLTAAQLAGIGVGTHNSLLSLQGGGGAEYYHLTAAQNANTVAIVSTPVIKTVSFSVATGEANIICNGTGTITVTLPTASAATGRNITIKTIAAFTVVSATSNVVPLVGGASSSAILAATAGKYAKLISDGTNWIIMEAN